MLPSISRQQKAISSIERLMPNISTTNLELSPIIRLNRHSIENMIQILHLPRHISIHKPSKMQLFRFTQIRRSINISNLPLDFPAENVMVHCDYKIWPVVEDKFRQFVLVELF